jgi:hypothetical protein
LIPYIDTKTAKTQQTINILQRQTDSVRIVMSGFLYSAAATLDATPNVNPAKLVLRAPAQRNQFNAETNKVILSELIKNLELSKMTLRKETPLIEVIDKPILPLDMEVLRKSIGVLMGGVIGVVVGLLLITIIKVYKNLMAS